MVQLDGGPVVVVGQHVGPRHRIDIGRDADICRIAVAVPVDAAADRAAETNRLVEIGLVEVVVGAIRVVDAKVPSIAERTVDEVDLRSVLHVTVSRRVDVETVALVGIAQMGHMYGAAIHSGSSSHGMVGVTCHSNGYRVSKAILGVNTARPVRRLYVKRPGTSRPRCVIRTGRRPSWRRDRRGAKSNSMRPRTRQSGAPVGSRPWAVARSGRMHNSNRTQACDARRGMAGSVFGMGQRGAIAPHVSPYAAASLVLTGEQARAVNCEADDRRLSSATSSGAALPCGSALRS